LAWAGRGWGFPQRKPACVALRTFPACEHDGKIFLQLTPLGENRTGREQEGEAAGRELHTAAA
jgi:hypothetical protein